MKQRNITAAWLSAWALLGSSAAAQEYTNIEWKPQEGQVLRYQSRMSHLSQFGLIEVTFATTERVTSVGEKEVVVERANGTPHITVNGEPNSQVQVGIPDRTLHYSSSGRFTRAQGGSPRGWRLESLATVVLLPKAVAYGETWVYRQDPDPEHGLRKTEFIYTYRGRERYYGLDAHRIGVQLREMEGPDPITAQGTVWLAGRDRGRLGDVYWLENVDLGMGPMRVKIAREPPDLDPQLKAAARTGRWRGQFEIPATGDVIEVWLNLKVSQEGQTELSIDAFSPDSPFGSSAEAVKARFEAEDLIWNLQLFGQEFQCRTQFFDFSSGVADCRSARKNLTLTLNRTLDTPWVPADLEEVAANAEQRTYTTVFRQAVLTVAGRDYEQFDQLFVSNPRGMQPNELWRAASKLLNQFGKIRRVEFLRTEDSGAYLNVTFDRAEREFFVRVDKAGKLEELTYVPPSTPHVH